MEEAKKEKKKEEKDNKNNKKKEKEEEPKPKFEFTMWAGWPPEHFGRIIVSGNMVGDHMPPAYREAFDDIYAATA